MNFCNCPNCQTENCPNAAAEARCKELERLMTECNHGCSCLEDELAQRDRTIAQLTADCAVMRKAIVQFVAWYHVDPFKGDKHWQELPDITRQAEKALALQPGDALKPGKTLDTSKLKELCEAVIRDIGNEGDIPMGLDWGWANLGHKSLPELRKFLALGESV